MTVQELIDWLEGVVDPDGVEGVNPDATVRVAIRRPIGSAVLELPAMSGETMSLVLDGNPMIVQEVGEP